MGGKWMIRTYKAGRVIEKSKFWVPANTKARAGRVKGNTSSAKRDQNARRAVHVLAQDAQLQFLQGRPLRHVQVYRRVSGSDRRRLCRAVPPAGATSSVACGGSCGSWGWSSSG